MKKILVIVAILLLGAWGQAWGANWFVDCNLGTGNNDGTTTDDAWRGTSAIKTAIEYGGYTAGDRVWIKRDSGYDEGVVGLNADIAPTDDGTATAPIYIIGWPRGAIPNTTITQADWTNGSATVDNIVGITCDREAHQARWATAPNGSLYLITQVVDANTVKIDREYAGATVTGTNGLFQIEADEDYATAQAIDDSAWTIKLSTWTDDAHDVPTIDFNNESYQLNVTTDTYYSFRNLNLIDSSDSSGITFSYQSNLIEWIGCLWKQNSNNTALFLATNERTILKRFTIEGSGSGNAQHGIYSSGSTGVIDVQDGAIFNVQSGIYTNEGRVFLKNVNIGVETATYYKDINAYRMTHIIGSDVNLGAGTIELNYEDARVMLENYGKVLGAHKTWFNQGSFAKLNVVAGSGDPYKRTGGASSVVDIKPDVTNNVLWSQDLGFNVFIHTYTSDGSSKTYRYYAQADALTTSATELWLEAEYVSAYDDTTEYVMSTVRSDETLTQRSGADDWDEYLEVTVDPATASTVRIFLKINKYDADGHIYVDPMVQIN